MPPEDSPPGSAPRERARRLFFALWPDEAMRRAMAQAIREAAQARRGSDPGCGRSDPAYGGRPVPAANLHVTLAFLGSVPEQRLPELAETARRAASPGRIAYGGADAPRGPIGLAFDHLEHWRAAQLLCAMPAKPSVPAAALADRLQALLAQRGFASDLKSSWSVGSATARWFRPHVTLARKVPLPPSVMQMQPVTWGFTDFVLVDSKTLPEGSVYTVLERFSFAR